MLTNARRLIVTLLITAVPTIAAFGQSLRGTGFVRILLPIAIQGEVFGALGSRWTTRVAITNSAAAPVDILGYDWSAYGCVNVCAEPPLTPPGVTFFPLVVPGTRTQGAILLVEPSHASDVDIDLRIQDVSRQSQTWGTELPVIAESGLFQRPFQMLDIPLGSDFRDMLRLYDVDAHEGATVRLRFFAVNPNTVVPFKFAGPQPQLDVPLLEKIVTLQAERRPGSPLFDLAYAEVPLNSLFEIQGQDRVRIEVAPLTSGLRLWGFVSVTNNQTQHVTTVVPQN